MDIYPLIAWWFSNSYVYQRVYPGLYPLIDPPKGQDESVEISHCLIWFSRPMNPPLLVKSTKTCNWCFIPLPSGKGLQKAIEAMAIEIMSFPINSMVMFHSYVTVYQRVTSQLLLHYHNVPMILIPLTSHSVPSGNSTYLSKTPLFDKSSI